MKSWIRRLRGLLGFGMTWGTAWAGIGAMVGLVIGIVRPEVWAVTNPIVEWAIGIGLYGLVSGVGFASLLSVAERRRTLPDLSLGRVATWGIIGSAAVPLVFGMLGTFEVGTTIADVIGAMVVTSGLGGVFAPGSVALARRAALEAGSTGRRELEEGDGP